jgi:ribosomal protein L11 methyltransferase
VIVVLATTDEGLPEVRAHLLELDLDLDLPDAPARARAAAPAHAPVHVVAPSDSRRLLLVPVDDEVQGARLVARLRAEGRLAVLRPATGARLESWVRHTRPVAIGDRLTVCFAWSEHDRRGLPNVVEIDPGGGFGAGGHPTTRLLLEELAARITGGERVLDVGCGSGVLGLGALRLGASSAVGVDIDPPSIDATRRNAGLNGFEDRMRATLAPLSQVEGTFDVVVANIGWAPLLELAPDLLTRVGPGGWLAVSGITPAHSSRVLSALRPLEMIGQRMADDWVALVLSDRRAETGTRPAGVTKPSKSTRPSKSSKSRKPSA